MTSRVSASPRRRHCHCRITGQQERTVRRRIRNFSGDHHRTSAVVTTARLLLLLSQQPRRYYRWIGYDTTGRSPLCSPSSKNRSTQNHGTPFTWDKTPYQSATLLLRERMSLRPSYVLHMRRRRVLDPSTVGGVFGGWLARGSCMIELPPWRVFRKR